MTLQESEARLSELNTEISKLLKERESVLREWNAAFNAENPDNITCIDESIGDNHTLYLVNGESKMKVCMISSYDMKSSIEEFYKHIDTSISIHNIAGGRDTNMPEYQKNLIYAKAIEIREGMKVEDLTKSIQNNLDVVNSLFGILPQDADIEEAREERMRQGIVE